MNVTTPDKKSVMMYVMCYFQVLPHSDIVIEDVPALAAASDKSSTNITGATKPPVPSQVNIEHYITERNQNYITFCKIFRFIISLSSRLAVRTLRVRKK